METDITHSAFRYVVLVLGAIALLSVVILSGCKAHRQAATSKIFKVTLPSGEPTYTLTEFDYEGEKHIGIFVPSIMELSPKEAFGWFLTLIVRFNETDEMPNNDDTVKMQDFSDMLDDSLAIDRSHPNALFLGRVTGKGQTQMMWYVNNPKLAHKYLQELIESDKYPFHFKYEIEKDPEWKEAHFWLDPLSEQKK